MQKDIPSYYLFNKNTNVNIEHVDYENHYDYTKPHRHYYFELLFFKTGGGSQLIDFNNYELKKNGIYLICPGQIHLMKRQSSANGLIVQFTNEFLMAKNIPWNLLFQTQFLEDGKLFDECISLVHLMEYEMENNSSSFKDEIVSDFLKIILLKLFGDTKSKVESDGKLLEFVTLLENKFKEWTEVSDYLSEMNTTSKKLNALTKKHLGKTALNIIHDRILLEAKRVMFMNKDMALKEIAYDLNFDSQASFSNFIKKKTGLYPTGLQKELLKEK